MSTARSAPPALPGFTLVEGIGSGGFADVFLFTQHHPNRPVAVKVLRAEFVSDISLRQFANEADVMAQVSAHPYIVTIYDSGIAPDGRPYIVMEHYSGDHFGIRARGGRLSVAEVLRVGVQVASAIETAHRADILHRDIKPANILTSAYGRPGLTDFGIASATADRAVEAAAGVTLAFSSPEVLLDEHATGSVTSDIYSFSATLFSLLSGHSPFWIPGADNTETAVVARVMSGAPPRLERADVPPSLAHLLGNGMARDPSTRPPSALAFARALQSIEQELSLAPTAIEVRDDLTSAGTARAAPEPADEDDGTRRAAPRIVNPDPPAPDVTVRPAEHWAPPAAASPTRAVAPVAPMPAPASPGLIGPRVDDPTWAPQPSSTAPAPAAAVPLDEADDDPATVMKRPAPPVERATTAADSMPAPARSRTAFVVGGVAAALVVAIAIAFVATRGGAPEPTATPASTGPTTAPVTVVEAAPETPTDLHASISPAGELTVTFAPPTGSTPTFRLTMTEGRWPDDRPWFDTQETTVVVGGFADGATPCFTIASIASGAISDPSPEVCAKPTAPADLTPTTAAETAATP